MIETLLLLALAIPAALIGIPVLLLNVRRRANEALAVAQQVDSQQSASGASLIYLEKRIAKLERAIEAMRPEEARWRAAVQVAAAVSTPLPESARATPEHPVARPEKRRAAPEEVMAEQAPAQAAPAGRPAPLPGAPPPPLREAFVAPAGKPAEGLSREPQPLSASPARPRASEPVPAEAPSSAETAKRSDMGEDPSSSVPTFGMHAEAGDAESGDWETRVGTNWLSRLGVAAMVVGLALFVGYAFANLGALGRVAMAATLSTAMLAGGVYAERRKEYLALGRGLIAGGWAGAYLTAFASYGVEAARVITDPAMATILLFSVAVGMAAHSLRYRSEALTTLAFVLASLSLGVSDSYGFALGALFPLAGAFLTIAHRLRWEILRLAGVGACYAAVVALMFFHPNLMNTGLLSSALVCLWLLFEAAACLAIRNGEEAGVARLALGVGNALLFLTLLAANGGIPELLTGETGHLEFTMLAGTLLMGCAGAVRARLTRAIAAGAQEGPYAPLKSDSAEETASPGDLLLGGYPPFATMASACLAGYSLLHFEGGAEVGALLAEGGLLVTLAVLFRQAFLARLSDAVFTCSLVRVYTGGVTPEPLFRFADTAWTAQSLLAIAHAGVLYVNRALFPQRVYYSTAATVLMLVTLANALPPLWLGAGIALVALGLFEAARRSGKQSLLLEGWAAIAVAALASGAAWIAESFGGDVPWQPMASTAALIYAAGWRIKAAHRKLAISQELAPNAVLAFAGIAAAAAVASLVDSIWLCVAWLMLAAVWMELRRVLRPAVWIVKALALGGAALAAQFGAWSEIEAIPLADPQFWLVQLAPVVLLFWMWHRLGSACRHAETPQWVQVAVWFPSALAAAALAATAAHISMEIWLGLLLMGCGIGVAAAGTLFRKGELRMEGYMLGLLGVVPAIGLLTGLSGEWMGISLQAVAGFLGTACLLALFGVAGLAARQNRGGEAFGAVPTLDAAAPTLFALLAGLYSVFVLAVTVEGEVLTICLGLEAILILALGVAANIRVLRLGALGLLLFAVGKLFFYDLASLAMPYRIASFFIMGALLLGVSWMYSRYGSRIRRLL